MQEQKLGAYQDIKSANMNQLQVGVDKPIHLSP